MSKALEIIKSFMQEHKLTATAMAEKLEIPVRTMQLRLKEDNFKVSDLEQIENVYGITIFAPQTKENSAQVNEPNASYRNSMRPSITINLGTGSNNPAIAEFEELIQKMIPKLLEQEKQQKRRTSPKIDTSQTHKKSR